MRKILSTYLLPLGLLTFTLISPNITIGQVDVLEQIEAELNAEKEKQKALQKAEKNAEKFAIKYRQTIARGDAFFKDKKYADAIIAYEEALTYKPDDHYAPEQAKEAKRLKKQFDEEQKRIAIEKSSQSKISEAQAAFDKKDWPNAIALFEEAKTIKPDDPSPVSKIAEAKKLMAKEEEDRKAAEAVKELQEKYESLMTEAEALLKGKSFDQARSKFEEASKLKPAEQDPKNKILACDQQKAEAEKQAKDAEIQAQYDKIIQEADALLKSQSFEAARLKYDDAVKLKPNENYPHSQIEEANRLEKQAVAEEKESKYKALIKEADALLSEESFDKAKLKYEESLKFKPGDKYAQDQVSKSDQLKEEKAQANLQASYDEIIAEGQKLVSQNQFDEAIVKFDEAHKLMPENPGAQEKIEQATKLKSEYLQKNKEEEYQKLLAEGDELVKAENFKEAIELYAKAEHILPENSEAPNRISKAKDLEKTLQQDKIDNEYASLIKQGDEQLKAKSFDEAAALYTEAERLAPEKQEAKTKMHELNLLKKDLLAEKTNNEFTALMDEGEELLKQEDFDAAEELFRKAHKLKPNETSPNPKIQDCHRLKSEKIARDKEAKEAQEVQEKYDAMMLEAKGYSDEGKYQKSTNTYYLVLEVVANDKTALAEIETNKKLLKEEELKKQASDEVIAKKQELERDYLSKLEAGDFALKQLDFDEAREKYEAAGALNPNDARHKEKLAALGKAEEDYSKEEARKEEEQEAALAAKKLEEERVKQLEKTTTEYEVLLVQGNKALASQNFKKAKEAYRAAIELLPNDPKASNKLENTLKAELEKQEELHAQEKEKKAAEAAEQERKLEAEAAKQKEKEYEELMTKAQLAANSGKFDEAIKVYEAAELLLPGRQQTADFLKIAKERIEKQSTAKALEEEQKRFESFYKAAETAYRSSDYDLAFASIDQAKKIKAEDPNLLSLEKKIEKKALEEEEREARRMALGKLKSKSKQEFTVVYLDPRRRDRLDEIKFVHDLATKYPEGLTVQYRTDDRKEVEVRIVVQKNLGAEYQKVTHDWGGTYYFKNGRNVSAYIWQKEAGGF